MIIRSLKRLGSVVILLTLGACAQTAPSAVLPDITFVHLTPYQLSVGSIEVESRFTMPMTAPNIEHRVQQSPEQVMRRWVGDRLSPAGGENFARFVILDASITENALETDSTLTAVFTNEQASRYDAVAEANLEIRNSVGNFLGNATARVTRSVTIPENASLIEREQALFDLVDQLMQSFNTEMDANIRSYLVQWIR